MNCLWEGRLALDHQMGLNSAAKVGLSSQISAARKAFPQPRRITFVHYGPGTVWRYRRLSVSTGLHVLVSRLHGGWCTTLTPPPAWESVCNGEADSKMTLPIVQEALAAFDCIVPGILSSKIEAVDAGIICSWGASDVGD